MNDDLERMFRTLVRTIQTKHPEHLTRPFEVGELYQTILPYRLYRRELGLDTNQDYELTLTELLTGARGFLLVDDRMADTLRRELASPNPEPGAFRQFASAEVAIGAEALAKFDTDAARAASMAAPPPSQPGAPVARASLADTAVMQAAQVPPVAASDAPTGVTGAMSAVSTPAGGMGAVGGGPTGRSPIVPARGDGCRFCGGALPAGRPITFCPHCGQDQTVLHCEACGTELEVGWKFCTTCGRGVAPTNTSSHS